MDRSSELKDLDEVVNKKIEIFTYKFQYMLVILLMV